MLLSRCQEVKTSEELLGLVDEKEIGDSVEAGDGKNGGKSK